MQISGKEKKGIGVNPQSQIHYIDHLAVICILMNIPLLFIDETDYSLGKKYYPGLHCLKVDYESLYPEFLVENFDVLFFSDLWDRSKFHEKFGPFEKKYNKTMRHVHCPHGFSDKAFYLEKCILEDIALLYGQNMLDMLKNTGIFQHLPYHVITGNYRYTYFKQCRSFFDEIVKTEILNKFYAKKPVILYAPTWLDVEESTTFFDAHQYLLQNLPADYNMIVKLHPRLELDDTAKYYQIIGKYEDKPNILFLKDFPLIYPLLAYTDIYIGDTSSVGYDFLSFNRPMFFLNKQKIDSQTDRRGFLFRCGTEIMPEEYSELYKILEKKLPEDQEQFSKIRSDVYNYTFAPERSFADIKHEIIHTYNQPYLP
jgi:CDP-Glycerol:Poly(glycerophosphate) glycerophosphotransferase